MRWLLYMLLFILALILFLLIVPAGARVKLDNGAPEVFAKVFGIGFKVYPREKKKKKKPKKPKEEKEEKAGEKKKGVKLSFGKISEYLSFASEALTRVVRGIYVSDFKLRASIHNEDPSKTALMYGGACSMFGTVIPKLERIFRIKKKSVELYPDFEGPMRYYLDMTVLAVPVKLVITGLILFFKWKKINKPEKAVQK